MPRRLSPRLIGAGVALLVAVPAHCATLCLVLTSPMSFGLYDTISPVHNDSTATVTVSCTPGLGSPLTTPYTLTVAGTGGAGDSVRSIAAGSHRLYYQVYKDAGRSLVWGNGSSSGPGMAGSVTSAATLVPGLQTHTAYTRLPARQAVPAAIYLGTLLVTIDY